MEKQKDIKLDPQIAILNDKFPQFNEKFLEEAYEENSLILHR